MASFIRGDKVDLSKYLPAFLTKDPEFAAKLAAESAVHDEIRQELDDILNQFFVKTLFRLQGVFPVSFKRIIRCADRRKIDFLP